MRGMTGLTISLLYGFMGQGPFYHLTFGHSLFLFLFLRKLSLNTQGVCVAGSAEGFLAPHNQFLGLGSVRFVTVRAALFIQQRPVYAPLFKYLIQQGVVASPAQFKSVFFRFEG